MAVAAAGTASVAGMATQSALVYLLAYTFTNVGAFAVVIMLERNDGTGTDIADFVGLSRTQPLLAMAMAIFMLSLTGIPLTAGFTGKWLVFQASLEAGLVPLAIIGVLTSVLSAYYYVRIIVNMYLVDGEAAKPASEHVAVSWSLYAALAATLLLGIFPTLVTNLAGVSTLVASVLP
jgi:NADH-quinone oxidoreductase subunit N